MLLTTLCCAFLTLGLCEQGHGSLKELQSVPEPIRPGRDRLSYVSKRSPQDDVPPEPERGDQYYDEPSANRESRGHRGPPEYRGPPDHRGPSDNRGPPDHRGPPEHRGPPGYKGPPDHRVPPDHRGPPENRGPPGNTGPPNKRGSPGNRGPPDHGGPPYNGGPPDNKGSPNNRGPPNNINNRGPPDTEGPSINRGPVDNKIYNQDTSGNRKPEEPQINKEHQNEKDPSLFVDREAIDERLSADNGDSSTTTQDLTKATETLAQNKGPGMPLVNSAEIGSVTTKRPTKFPMFQANAVTPENE